MQIKRLPRTGLVAAGLLAFAVVTAGCGGGSSSKATPLGSIGGSGASTTIGTSMSSGANGGSPSPSTGAATSPTTRAGSSAGAKPTAAQLAAVTRQLDLAGSSLSGTDGAISGSDVNQAKLQEGSAP